MKQIHSHNITALVTMVIVVMDLTVKILMNATKVYTTVILKLSVTTSLVASTVLVMMVIMVMVSNAKTEMNAEMQQVLQRVQLVL